jgi:hypothetical protein
MTPQMARSVVEEPAGDLGTVRLPAPLTAALRYASAMGWAVAPGCDQGRGGRRCGRPDCLVAGPHPASTRSELAPTRDEHTIYRWWRRGRSAPVLLAVGRSFDILDIPSYAAGEALRQLRLSGCRLGPVALTGSGRLLVWTAPSTVEGLRWPYDNVDLRLRGGGEYVTAPPARESRWIEPPLPYTHRVLPSCADLLDAMVGVCARSREHLAGRRSRPCRGPWFGRSGAP